jgi:hypothetical protein
LTRSAQCSYQKANWSMLDTYFERLEELATLYFEYIGNDQELIDAQLYIINSVPEGEDAIEWVVYVGEDDLIEHIESTYPF